VVKSTVIPGGMEERVLPVLEGSCFPKDVRALMIKAGCEGVETIMLEAALLVNEVQPYKTVELTKQIVGELKGKRIGVLGLAFF